ncbi:MAG: MbcA/ParS/Xre antitoxin family protein [Nitrospira sp.]|nr:MbcA/ParS/Xre antitoxin family protein [Nitrospira sp.]MCY3956046.1 MbcA/ParS/Xre antitoxin family protein [Nitrospira sp.]
MNAGTETLLPFLGQGQGQPESSEPVPRFNLALTESGMREREAGLKTLSSYQAQAFASEEKRPTDTDAWLSILSNLSEILMRPSDVGQFSIAGSQKVIVLVAGSAKASPYRSRITGPVKFVNKLLATWHLEPESACVLLGFEPSRFAYVNDVLQGYETLTGRDTKDRIVHLIQIRTSLSALFRDETVENEWLREPHDTLNGKKPMDLLLEGSMENLLLVKEYVELVART